MVKQRVPNGQRVCMLVSTDVSNDPRVIKEGSALASIGYHVHAVGFIRQGDESPVDMVEGVSIRRLNLWHYRFVRWIKRLLGLKPTQGVFGNIPTPSSSKQKTLRFRMVTWVHDIELLLHYSITFIVLYLYALRQRADIYHANDADTLLPTILAGLTLKRPVIYDSHEFWYEKRRNYPIARTMIRSIERFALPRCAHIITPSPSVASQIVQVYGVRSPTVVMNVPLFSVNESPIPLQPDQRIRLLYHGVYIRDRGLEHLIEAMEHVTTPVELILRGYGDIEPGLRQLADHAATRDRVIFAPPVHMSQLVESARDCHIGVIPIPSGTTFTFALPNKLFEYMAAGLAIITNDLPEVCAVVNQYNLGATYASRDPRVLATVIDELARDRERLEQYRHHAWEAYNHTFTWSAHRQVLFDLYATL